MFDKFRKLVAKIITSGINTMSLPKKFLKYGSKGMRSDWTEVIMSDSDLYTGYGYAAIRNRANKVASVAMQQISTDSSKKDSIHPYLETISSSPTFSDYSFWQNISTYLDLEGVYYLMVIRAIAPDRMGKIQQFKLLNPYNIRRVMDKDGLEVGGYVESKMGFVREIPKEMIIPIMELNPFDETKPFAMTDAAKESQFTLKTAGDYTRHALRNNINAPGILSTDVALEKEDFENFIERIKNHKKGEPIFGNGSGAITWENMQTSIKDSGLKDINETNRDSLFAVSGVSKTLMGIEQSGTTRETSNVQKDLNVENHILPRIQLIIDALNQDYKNNYSKDYNSNKAIIIVNNPLETDHDADIKEADAKTKAFDLYTSLVDKGYDEKLAAQYVQDEIDLDKLGKPKNKPKETPVPVIPPTNSTKEDIHKNEAEQGLIQQQEGGLKNAIVNIESSLIGFVINQIRSVQIKKNDIKDYGSLFDKLNNLIPVSETKKLSNELLAVLISFYGVVITYEGSHTMNDRMGKFALLGKFTLDKDIKDYIKETSKKVADGHIETISNEMYQDIRESALKGLSQEQLIQEAKSLYGRMSETRAKTVARTETNRAFTRAQFEADKQFIDQNNLQGRVFKQWHTRSENPCPFCIELESEGLVPFEDNFRDLGSVISVGTGNNKKTLDVGFESIQAGNAHPNCSCDYSLIIKPENNSILLQELEEKYNDLDKRTSEAKILLTEIKNEREKLNIEKDKMKSEKENIDKLTEELEKIT